jgi:hypothetical protein
MELEEGLVQSRLKPLNDVVFKKLFGEEVNKHLLIGLLNAV